MEGREIHCLGVPDHGHDQRPAAVLLLYIDGEAKADGAGINAMRLAVDLLECVRHHRELLGGLDDRVADQVGERDLLAARGELGVEGLPTGIQRRGRDVAEGRRGRNGERLGHVGY